MSDVPVQQAQRALAPIEQFRQTLTAMEKEFAVALPPQIPVQKFVRTVITTMQMNPQLLECDRRSIFATAMKAAQDGLLLDGREAAPVMFRSKNGPMCQYMPMIGGLLKKLRNSGELLSISAYTAHEHDKFEYELGDEEKIIHKPRLDGPRGGVIAAYAVAKTKDGGIYCKIGGRPVVDILAEAGKSVGDKVVAKGKSAHAASNYLGDNAVYKLLPIIAMNPMPSP